jgi:hypothetical protein
MRDSDMSDIIEHIRTRAYQLWEADGRPEGRDTDYWHEAERQVTEGWGSNGTNEGEGSQTGARQYNEAATEFAQSGAVEAAAQDAATALDTAEAPELEKAEQAGRNRRHGADEARRPKPR